MLIKRIVTGIVAIPLLTALIFWGSESVFLIIVMLTAYFGLIEFYKMNLADNRFTKALAITVGLVAIWLIYYYQDYITFNINNGPICFVGWSLVFITLAVFTFLIRHLILFPRNTILVNRSLIAVIGIVYVSLFLSYLILIRGKAEGGSFVFFTFLVIWFGDSGAYAVGKMIGKHQLCPIASPNKTIEGALGGVAASLIAAFCAKTFFLKQITVIHCVVLALGIAMVGLLGDICESTFKRKKGIKDSGNLLPGHGGMLDRIDSILFAAPLVYYYKILILT